MRLDLISAVMLLALLCTETGAEERASFYVDQGNLLWSQNRILEAEQSFRNAIQLAPGEPMAYARLAALYLTSRQNDKAVAAYQQAIDRDPENANLVVAQALAHFHGSDYEQARAMIERALQLDPGLEHAHRLMEHVERRQAMLAKAAKAGEDERAAAKMAYPPIGNTLATSEPGDALAGNAHLGVALNLLSVTAREPVTPLLLPPARGGQTPPLPWPGDYARIHYLLSDSAEKQGLFFHE